MTVPAQATRVRALPPARSRLHALEPFIVRERLLDRLPDADGFVLWLSAPYGYGKSVLLAQWAAGVELGGRSIVWLSAEREDVRSGIAAQLALPTAAPWPLLLDELARRDCAVVIEEAEAAGEAVDVLLSGFDGLVALASRGELGSLELPRRFTQGRLVRLAESDMAFTPAEVERLWSQLSGDGGTQAEAHALWRLSGGWPLALHFALLSGGAAALETLARGLTEALPADLRAELLLIAAVGELPKAAGSSETMQLVERGLAQELTQGYRLHPVVSDALLEQDASAAAEQVTAARERLPWPLWAGALARLELRSELSEALGADASLLHAVSAPETWLAWHALAPGGDSAWRRLGEAAARIARTDFTTALPELLALLPDETLSADHRAFVAARAVAALAAARRLNEAEAVAAAASRAAASARLSEAWTLRHALATLHVQKGDLAEAEKRLASLVAEAPRAGVDPTTGLSAEMLLYLTRFELSGDHFAYIAAMRSLVARGPQAGPKALTTLHHNLGIHLLAMGETAAGREHLLTAAGTADRMNALVIGMALAYYDRDLDRFPQLLAESRLWEYDMLTERVAALWLRTLRALGEAERAAEVARELPDGPFVLLEKAWEAHAAGEAALAADRLARSMPAWEAQGAIVNRDYRQHLAAMSFIVLGGEERLDALLALSPQRERLLPMLLVPLASLPRNRPELSVHYPLQEVINSGWEGAVTLRRQEVPPLRLRLLGGFSVGVLGEELRVSRRHRELLTLIALKVPRGRWAEELWPDALAKHSENNLRVQLHLLKRELAVQGEQLYLPGDELAHVDSDLGELNDALESEDADRVARLYIGELAPDVDLPAVAEERAVLAAKVVELLRREVADLDGAARRLQRALEIDPLNEELLRQLLEVLLEAGRRSMAERVARDFGRRLEAELGYGLSDETLELLVG